MGTKSSLALSIDKSLLPKTDMAFSLRFLLKELIFVSTARSVFTYEVDLYRIIIGCTVVPEATRHAEKVAPM